MTFQQKILAEHAVKYLIITVILWLSWSSITAGLSNAVQSGKLEAIAVIMGIVALCSLTGYYTFSYTVVAKTPIQRYFGYLCTLLMGVSLTISLFIIYFIATLWVPEMSMVWSGVLGSLYLGTVIYDNFDLLRMGKDVAAINFFETSIGSGVTADEDHLLEATVEYLREGQRLPFANSLIGRAVTELGQDVKNVKLVNGGKWITEQAEQEQHVIDQKIVELFKPFQEELPKVGIILDQLAVGQSQHVADHLVATLIEEIDSHFDRVLK